MTPPSPERCVPAADAEQVVAALFVLLRSGLWSEAPHDVSAFPLAPAAWRKVLALARKQTVTGLVYEGICRLPESLMPPDDVLFVFVAETDVIERRNRRANQALAELYAFFAQHNLTPVLQKGQGVALLYDNPLRRDCGDIDLYFTTPLERRRAAEAVHAAGIETHTAADGSLNYRWQGISVEHHVSLCDVANPWLQSALSEVVARESFTRVALAQPAGCTLTVPAVRLNLLLLNTHVLKHALGWGIGLRQLCDLARAYRSAATEGGDRELERLYRRFNLGKWSDMLHAFLTECLGLKPEWLPYKGRPCDWHDLLRIVLQGGNFGHYGKGRQHTARSGWSGKARTSWAYVRGARFAAAYAPAEAFWTFTNLLIGSLRWR